jgi:multidrug resistance efflux pump
MIGFLKKLFAIGTVAGAIGLLVWASLTIQKNTPQKLSTKVRFSPPTFPGTLPVATNASSTQQRQTRDGGGSASERDKSAETGARYIGGIGIVEPAGEAIAIGSQVPGIVTRVFVKPGEHVREGDPLMVLEDRSARANVKVAQANLAAQQAKLRELQGQIAPLRAKVDSASALLEQARASQQNALQEVLRAEKVVGNGISFEELELRRLNAKLAESRILDAEARLRESQSSLDLLAGPIAPSILVQQAAVEQAIASVAKEDVELQLRTIVAPRDATVLQVKIRVGEFAPAAVLATPLITLGVIDPLHIRVDIDESEIPRFCSSAEALVSVRGRPEVRVPMQYVRTEPYVVPKRTLTGSVSERVDTRVMQIIYSVSPAELEAIPGQQVDVYIAECVH